MHMVWLERQFELLVGYGHRAQWFLQSRVLLLCVCAKKKHLKNTEQGVFFGGRGGACVERVCPGQADADVQWSEEQELALVRAMKQYGKEVEDRWEKISTVVPGKTKAQCFRRFKELRDTFRSAKK
jgi:Myb-like DNA-binding domain